MSALVLVVDDDDEPMVREVVARYLTLDVSDAGPGFPSDFRVSAFDRFTRANCSPTPIAFRVPLSA